MIDHQLDLVFAHKHRYKAMKATVLARRQIDLPTIWVYRLDQNLIHCVIWIVSEYIFQCIGRLLRIRNSYFSNEKYT